MKAQDLKNSILQLAIQGKLVAQDANDEPAEVLYAKIQAEKQKLIKEGKIKKDKPLPPITDDEIPFEIPSTWKWVRLGDIAIINGGFAFKSTQYKDAGIRVIRISDFDENGFKNNKIVRYNYTNDLEQYLIELNNIIMAMTGGTVGKNYFVSNLPEQMVSNQRVATIKINSNICPEYVNIVILSPIIQKLIQISKNSTNDNISMDLINGFIIPLPPLAEQKRIVAKIEELEPLIKQYDKAETELSALNGSFPEQLKKSILQYAIQGKLIAQDTNDEPAEVLYAQIQAEKQKLIKEGKIKKDKPLPPITDDEIPFEIPSTWKWVRLGDVASYIQRGKSPSYADSGECLVASQKCVQWEGFDILKAKYVTECFANTLEKFRFIQKGDLLWNSTGMGTVGRICLIPEDINHKCVVDSHVTLIRIIECLPEYIYYFIKSPQVQNSIDDITTGTTKQKELNLSVVVNHLVPLPPLAEQKRIVAKVNDLMQYCEELVHPEKRKNVEPITIGWLIDKGFASCQQNGYTDVNAILDELGIAVMQDRNLKKGRIEYDNNKKKFQIWVNDLNDNWTKTHELVHYVNDNNEIKLYGAVGRKDETSLSKSTERNVDVLTAEILMPEDIFVSAVEHDNIKKYALVENAIIRKLGKQFRVSDNAVKIRLQNLGYHTK